MNSKFIIIYLGFVFFFLSHRRKTLQFEQKKKKRKTRKIFEIKCFEAFKSATMSAHMF